MKGKLDPYTLRSVSRRAKRMRSMARLTRRQSDDTFDKEYWAGFAAACDDMANLWTTLARAITSRKLTPATTLCGPHRKGKARKAGKRNG